MWQRNPSRSSSGFQFYIVQKGQQTDSLINKAIDSVNFWTAKNNVLNKPELQDDFDAYQRLTLLQDGEVVRGLNVVDTIAAVEADEDGRPTNNIYIIKARMIKRKSYK